MSKLSTITACVLVLSAPVAMAQGTGAISQPLHYERQQAMVPVSQDQAKRTFIYDELGNVYDSRGELIAPRALKMKR